ncbi:hypothetical protein LTR09_004548 [Extremus antarcticus]|uniref:Uncharacterized protein n=1 Tax=Extremus antarcticus TaxID=702011 RepID=A0AAJ0DI13_9PEZI|nr:hypothetical protein LTR09_004548 [Extremus antarcticus]
MADTTSFVRRRKLNKAFARVNRCLSNLYSNDEHTAFRDFMLFNTMALRDINTLPLVDTGIETRLQLENHAEVVADHVMRCYLERLWPKRVAGENDVKLREALKRYIFHLLQCDVPDDVPVISMLRTLIDANDRMTEEARLKTMTEGTGVEARVTQTHKHTWDPPTGGNEQAATSVVDRAVEDCMIEESMIDQAVKESLIVRAVEESGEPALPRLIDEAVKQLAAATIDPKHVIAPEEWSGEWSDSSDSDSEVDASAIPELIEASSTETVDAGSDVAATVEQDPVPGRFFCACSTGTTDDGQDIECPESFDRVADLQEHREKEH